MGDWESSGMFIGQIPNMLVRFFDELDYEKIDPIYHAERVPVFVVGTEKKGYKDHKLLSPEAKYLGRFTTVTDRFRILKTDKNEPMVCKDKYRLRGEFYEVPGCAIKNLDKKYTSHMRVMVEIVNDYDETETAWLYHARYPLVTKENDKGIRVVEDNVVEYIA